MTLHTRIAPAEDLAPAAEPPAGAADPAPEMMAIPGVEGLLEPVLWRGRPSFRSAARFIWRLPLAAAWFALLLADGVPRTLAAGREGVEARQGEGALLLVALATLGLLAFLAWRTSRSSRYAVTETHLVLRYGLAFDAVLAVPMAAVEKVQVALLRSGDGDVAVTLKPGARLAYVKLWPHVRPLRLARPEPMLRGLGDAGVAAAVLARRARSCDEIRARLRLEEASAA